MGRRGAKPAEAVRLDAGWMGLDDEAAALGVNQRVALAPVDLLARIVTARAGITAGVKTQPFFKNCC